MILSFSPEPHQLSSLQRLVKMLVSALGALLLTGGVPVSAKTRELTEPQLAARLADPKSGMKEFIATLENSMITDEMWHAEELIDQEAILNRATDGVQISGSSTMKDLFADSTQRSWQENGLTRDFAGTNFRFLRERTFKNRAGLLFRSAGDNQSLNFHCFVLAEPRPREYRITDIYTLGLNEYTSDTLRRTYLHLAASLLGDEGRALSADGGVFADSLEQIGSISQQLKGGDWAGVLESCAALPPDVQRDRSVLLMRLEAAEHYSVTTRAEVMEEWLGVFPDEMDLPLKLADHYIKQERWNDAERVVRGVERRTGGDARLKLQLGNISYRRDRQQTAPMQATVSSR